MKIKRYPIQKTPLLVLWMNTYCLKNLQWQSRQGFSLENYLQCLISEGRIPVLHFNINSLSNSEGNEYRI